MPRLPVSVPITQASPSAPVHVHVYPSCSASPPAGEPVVTLAAIMETIMALAEKIEQLRSEVAQTTTVTQSAVTLIQGLRDQLKAVESGELAITEVIATLDANEAALANAVTGNTVAAGEQPAEPPPVA